MKVYYYDIDEYEYTKKFKNEKVLMKLCIIKNNDIVGLDDCIIDDKNIFTVECISYKGEYFKILSDVFFIQIGL